LFFRKFINSSIEPEYVYLSFIYENSFVLLNLPLFPFTSVSTSVSTPVSSIAAVKPASAVPVPIPAVLTKLSVSIIASENIVSELGLVLVHEIGVRDILFLA
jgi:hypothetical protein